MVGIVGLGWIIFDLEEKKGIPGGVDVMIKVFILLKYNTCLPIYSV